MAIENIVWASKAPDGKVIAPSTEKQQQGYDAEIPTAENFNWILRNVTGRLKTLEETWVDAALVSEAGTRDEVISAGEAFTVPEYIVGTGALRVYLDGFPCVAGPHAQYQEVGEVGKSSTSITWNDNIPVYFQIVVQTRVSNMTAEYDQWLRTKVDKLEFSASDWDEGVLSLPTDRPIAAIYQLAEDGTASLAVGVSISRLDSIQLLKTDVGFDGYVLVFSLS